MEAVIRIIQGSLVTVFLRFLPVTGNCDDLNQIKSSEITFQLLPSQTYKCLF